MLLGSSRLIFYCIDGSKIGAIKMVVKVENIMRLCVWALVWACVMARAFLDILDWQ